jgi:hypothetical protein
MSYINNIKKNINDKLLAESVSNDNTEPEEVLDELNTSDATPGYLTPNAFGGLDDSEIEILGYKKVKKKKASNESIYKQISEELFLNEISYVDYKKDEEYSSKQKVNRSIHEMNRRLREVQRILQHNIKLKSESNLSEDQYWKSSREKYGKIKEKVLFIAKQLKELGL